MDQKILERGDYELINQLSLAAKRRIAGLITGEQRSPVQGGGIEFADYREYQPGDDPSSRLECVSAAAPFVDKALR